MASAIMKKACFKCDKGIGILTCDGCQQSFCTKHIVDHRQELAIQMDNISQEYDVLRRDLFREDNVSYPILARINLWEQESITKIQQIAEHARNDLRLFLDRNQNETKTLFKKITDELQASQESGDYTEIDFKSWMAQLTELRKTLEKPPTIDIMDDDNTATSIRMIKMKERSDLQVEQNNLTSLQSNLTETFNKFIGDVILSDNNLLATDSGNTHHSTMVCVTELYSSGTHRIRCRIEHKTNKYLFFGIVDSLQEMTRTVFKSPSLYGWMSPDIRVVKSQKVSSGNTGDNFNGEDEVSLILNCSIQQIVLEHHRTNTIDRLPIDLRVCPLPWRVVIAFFSRNDSVRIIR